jgi:hypothetical protein
MDAAWPAKSSSRTANSQQGSAARCSVCKRMSRDPWPSSPVLAASILAVSPSRRLGSPSSLRLVKNVPAARRHLPTDPITLAAAVRCESVFNLDRAATGLNQVLRGAGKDFAHPESRWLIWRNIKDDLHDPAIHRDPEKLENL